MYSVSVANVNILTIYVNEERVNTFLCFFSLKDI